MSGRNELVTADCVVVGGGVIGLSIAYQLSCDGLSVSLLDRVFDSNSSGKQASWAGAGIIPPPNRAAGAHPSEQLHRLSYDLHVAWSERLKAESGIDNGLRRCGAIYIARSAGEAASLLANLEMLAHQLISASKMGRDELIDKEPDLYSLVDSGQLKTALYLPDELQLRNPRHLRALRIACQKRNVHFVELPAADGHSPLRWKTSGGRAIALETDEHTFQANDFCIAAGAWSYEILKSFGVTLGVFPMRGQMLLFRADQSSLSHVINEGPRYLVPRGDGFVLAGSTEEEVGFANHTTEEARLDLLEFARTISPQLDNHTLIDSWSGLRPATLDGVPFIGTLSDPKNLFYATGHFRSGLTMSTGTALVMSQLIRGEQTDIDVHALGINRGV